MANLNSLTFTNGNDTYSDETLFGGPIDAMSGNDSLTAKLPSGSKFMQAFSVSGGVLRMGEGNDSITGDGGAGFQCNGIIMGSSNAGIEAGGGNDRITGIGSGGGAGGFGISVFTGYIDTGSGNDVIIGRSGAANLGIYNYGSIEMGSGDDLMIASGMINGGRISMGSGNDIIKLETAEGYQNGGMIDLGIGDDVVRGVGSGEIKGSSGIDAVLLKAGKYDISETDGGYQVGGSLFLSSIERIGSAQSLFALPLHEGTLEIKSNGLAVYV